MDGVKPDTLTIIVIFGTRAESVVTSITPANSAFSAVTAVMLIGTSLNRSDRRCAVTIISPSNGACWAWPDCGEVASACALACAIGHNDTPTKRRSEEHTSELQSLMRISYAVLCLKKKKNNKR